MQLSVSNPWTYIYNWLTFRDGQHSLLTLAKLTITQLVLQTFKLKFDVLFLWFCWFYLYSVRDKWNTLKENQASIILPVWDDILFQSLENCSATTQDLMSCIYRILAPEAPCTNNFMPKWAA